MASRSWASCSAAEIVPNLLAHYGIQVVATRAVSRAVRPQWLLVGCVLPDLPWILARAVAATGRLHDPYTLKLYTTVQGSLVGCLLLAGALALVAAAPRAVFLLLASSALVHLCLDACQTSWGDGVHLFAPVSWEHLNLALFWPGRPVSLLLTGFGLLALLWLWPRRLPWNALLARPSTSRLLGAAALVAAYTLAPFAFLNGPEAADNYSLGTLREVSSRPGRPIELERVRYVERDGRGFARTFAGEELRIAGGGLGGPGTLSLRATFVDETTIAVRESHRHPPWFRDASSYLGLLALVVFWAVPKRGVGSHTKKRRHGARP